MNREAFTKALRTALMQLDDLQNLRHNPLFSLFQEEGQAPSAVNLQNRLITAIEDLKKQPSVHASRNHEILYYRYVEQLTQKEVAFQLDISIRQLRRVQNNAIELLADLLWNAILEERGLADAQSTLATGDIGEDHAVDQEITWLRTEYWAETSNVQAELDKALQAADVLLRHYKVQIQVNLPPQIPRVAAPSLAVRQSLLTVLTAIIPRALGQPLIVSLKQIRPNLILEIQHHQAPARPDDAIEPGLESSLHTASQLLLPFNGSVVLQQARPLTISGRTHRRECPCVGGG